MLGGGAGLAKRGWAEVSYTTEGGCRRAANADKLTEAGDTGGFKPPARPSDTCFHPCCRGPRWSGLIWSELGWEPE